MEIRGFFFKGEKFEFTIFNFNKKQLKINQRNQFCFLKNAHNQIIIIWVKKSRMILILILISNLVLAICRNAFASWTQPIILQ
jgi:hypothetical protein